MIILGILALILVLIIGSCVYLVHRVKEKVSQYATELKEGPGQPQAGHYPAETRKAVECPAVERSVADQFTTAAASASIPLVSGLTLIDIWTDPNKGNRDVEILQTVKGVHSSTIETVGARIEPNAPPERNRTLCIADLLDAHEYESMFGMNTPATIPGATMFSMSQAVFQDLKAGRPSALNYISAYYGEKQTYKVQSMKGSLTRVEPNDVPYSAIVNGDRKDLPAIHVRGMLGERVYEAWILDDPANPITLNIVAPATQWHLTYVKINFPVEKKVEQDLAQNGRAEIYGIYFDFDSATLRAESGPVMKEISDALAHNPAWKIRIEGHTDNVGGDDYNLRLSQRRAEAVKQALVSEYHITADRMSPQGFGASRPKATNDTIEGRALNRRVELVRE